MDQMLEHNFLLFHSSTDVNNDVLMDVDLRKDVYEFPLDNLGPMSSHDNFLAEEIFPGSLPTTNSTKTKNTPTKNNPRKDQIEKKNNNENEFPLHSLCPMSSYDKFLTEGILPGSLPTVTNTKTKNTTTKNNPRKDQLKKKNNNVNEFPLDTLSPMRSYDKFLAEETFPGSLPTIANAKNKNASTKDNLRKDQLKLKKNNNENSEAVEEFGYRDFSQFTDEEALKKVNKNININKSSQETFPTKLHKIISRCEIDEYSDVISWLPHGRAFRIHDTKAFVTKVMPKYFYISKITSFIRQLSLYGFRKVSRKGIDKGAYYHDMFLAGRPGLCAGVVRLSIRPTLKSKYEPNFYKMLPVYHLPTIEDIKRGYIADRTPEGPRPIQYHVQDESSETISAEEHSKETRYMEHYESDSKKSDVDIPEKKRIEKKNESKPTSTVNDNLFKTDTKDRVESSVHNIPMSKSYYSSNLNKGYKIEISKTFHQQIARNRGFTPERKFCYSSAA